MSGEGNRIKSCCVSTWKALSRTKTINANTLHDTQLKRCLGILDLTALGVGCTLGAGIYVIVGEVARTQAGPAVVLSFLIAAIASLLSGICYAEFSSRVPRAGSAYVYSYIIAGEFWAFVIGWNMIMENVIGMASVAKAWSQYFDSLFNDTIKHTIMSNVGEFNNSQLSEYPDFLSMTLILLVTLMASLGVKTSSMFNMVFTFINLLVILCIITICAYFADGKNWTDPPGFFPFGAYGVFSGAATCFYAFVGFDTVATSGEEAKTPSKSIPTAIMVTLLICFLAYFGVSTVITLAVPWYELADSAPLPKIFIQLGLTGAEYVITIGGLCGLTASIMGCMYPLPRTIYAMAQDGLVFRSVGRVNSWTNTPVIATWICGIFAAVTALFFSLDALVQMMSIGTLMAYTLVSVSVLLLRYQSDHVGFTAADLHQQIAGNTNEATDDEAVGVDSALTHTEETGLLRVGDKVKTVQYTPKQETHVFTRVNSNPDGSTDAVTPTGSGQNPSLERQSSNVVEEVRQKQNFDILRRMGKMMSTTPKEDETPLDNTYRKLDNSNYSLHSLYALLNLGENNTKEPTAKSRIIASCSVALLITTWFLVCLLSIFSYSALYHLEAWVLIPVILMLIIMAACLVAILRQPQNKTRAGFNVPFVPFLPLLAILINTYLMLTLSPATWWRFVIWMIAGFLMYFGYGIWNSEERNSLRNQSILYDVGDTEAILGKAMTVE